MRHILWTILSLTIGLTVFSQALSDDTLHWTEYRKLTWDDFKGEPIELQALSAQTMAVVLANFKKGSLFLPTTTSVQTVFDRRNSWTSNSVKTDQSLKYHQTTFDLYEVYARRLRKEFKQAKFGLDPNKIFHEKYNAILTALSDRNKQYMKETKMGQDAEALDRWSKTIQAELKELDLYKRTK